MPPAVFLPDPEGMIGNAFNLGVKAMALEIEGLPMDPALHTAGRDASHRAAPADKALEVKLRQELAQPGMKKLLPTIARRDDGDLLSLFDSTAIGDQAVE